METSFFFAEHVHVLLNHLPVIGLAMGLVALIAALGLRSRSAQVVAFGLIFLSAFSAWPVNVTGQRSYKNIRGMADDDGVTWLDEHMERAEKTAPAFYALAALAATAAVAPRKWPRSALPLSIATLLLALGCAGASSWIALAGGQIRHPEFRSSAAPFGEPAETHHHDPE